MSTENGPKSVATEGPKNPENPKPWKKRTKTPSPGGARNTRPKMKKKQKSENKKILRATRNNRQAKNKIEVQIRL